jgi:hypothetical protein
MRKVYCTFGDGQPNGGCVLPILAEDMHQARSYMFETYGPSWCTSYTEEQWNDWKKRAPFYVPIEKELPEVNLTNWKPKGTETNEAE